VGGGHEKGVAAVSARKSKERRSGGVVRGALGLTLTGVVWPVGHRADRLAYRVVNVPSELEMHRHGTHGRA
jgi:hypothetical protein